MKSTEEPRSNSWTYSDKFYHKDYVAKNREAINARKREWRKARKLKQERDETRVINSLR